MRESLIYHYWCTMFALFQTSIQINMDVLRKHPPKKPANNCWNPADIDSSGGEDANSRGSRKLSRCLCHLRVPVPHVHLPLVGFIMDSSNGF